MQSLKRVQREVRELAASKDLAQGGLTVEVVDGNLSHLHGYLRGPADSPYDGACLQLDIEIPENYPFSPPVCKFITRIWHPNISSQTGVICLDVLKENWAATMTIRTVLLSIQALLTVPEPKDPQDAVVASQYMKNPALFNRTARFWAQHFAEGPGEKEKELQLKVSKLCEMGVDRDTVISQLSYVDWDLDRAIANIF
ncbi:unnamed protein product [Bursaphelenchus xylophilus]|uniref:(pine wood nematode) hypothetical protein n=1 Tax=Bursaphelenchus xylophilus TaxID=6326 RepID=A0A1I7RLV2_BURXY|nr:unnamed protein product [Bursaphelenchus xylophilus]CAG9106210.1 unnamed protein product [Bursaphelenchus xylophilus]